MFPKWLFARLASWLLECAKIQVQMLWAWGQGSMRSSGQRGVSIPNPHLAVSFSVSLPHTQTRTRTPSLGILYDLLLRCQFDSIPICSCQCLLFAGSCKSDRDRGERDLPQIFSGTLFIYSNIYLLIWLRRVLVALCGIFSCGVRDLLSVAREI